MFNCDFARDRRMAEDHQGALQGLPPEVVRAQHVDWSVGVDAFLFGAARVGERYVALVYNDQSGVSKNGMTIATPPVRCIAEKDGFKLVRSIGGDHYVIISEHDC